MYKEDIVSFLKDPVLLNDTDPVEFNSVIEDYPLFTAARVMQLLAAGRSSNQEFNVYLKQNASWLNNYNYIRELLKEVPGENPVADISAILAAPAEEAIGEIVPAGEDALLASGADYQEDILLSFDFNRKSGVEKPETDKKSNNSKVDRDPSGKQNSVNRKFELIDRFIAINPGSIRSGENEPEVGFLNIKDSEDEESLITDTLAKIYIKQGLYSKAIYSYEKLILKYPEKSVYFAAQIEDIKKLINK